MNRRSFLGAGAGAVLGAARGRGESSTPSNVVMIFADDLGYGDLGCYGSGIPTPHLDGMARKGAQFGHFYSASAVCSPSRAALLTGRYPVRVNVPRVLSAGEPGGLAKDETTMAQMLKDSGYATSCVGKWHLGTDPGYMPTSRGFDEFYGMPYSHDMWPRPLMHNDEIIECPADISTLTQRYTQQAASFIQRSVASSKPFFLYLAHSAPHLPLAASPGFRYKSGQGLYGDVVGELDWSVGAVLQTLKELGVDGTTLVMFSSDNGPWYQGSSGPFRGRKGSTYEGGVRMPFLARMPGRIPAGLRSNALSSAMDILPTVAGLTGATLPPRPLDGVDLWPVLSGQADSVERDVLLYFDDVNLQCARMGDWKAHLARYNTPPYSPAPACGRQNLALPSPELYDLAADPGENYDRAEGNSTVLADIKARVNRLLGGFPAVVWNAWNDTQGRKVQDAPTDGLPVAGDN
jgi:arylsulfatase A